VTPEFGWRLAKTVTRLDVADVLCQHHERFDGSGYPGGRSSGHAYPDRREVCDSWAAMLADRPYQKAITEDQAVRELLSGRGTQFDPDVGSGVPRTPAARGLGPLLLLDLYTRRHRTRAGRV
jgi:HD-GYP domain-containing protein (c-di-GMP phosphodiesterase class II)